MKYKHYTRCVGPNAHVGFPVHVLAWLAMILPVIIVAGFGPGISLAVIMGIIAFCRWWLYNRLVCLDGDRCAVGLLVETYPPDKKSLIDPPLDAFDTDYSIDILLAPNTARDLRPVIFSGFQAELIRETDITKNSLPYMNNGF